MAGPVYFSADAYEAMHAQVRRSGNEECCGALVGEQAIERIIPLANEAGDRQASFAISPRALFELERTMPVAGFYHSHPNGTSVPSRRDLEFAWPGYVYVIVGHAIRAWKLEPDGTNFRELPVVVQ